MLIVLSSIIIVGIFLVMNGIPMILCFISVLWNVCLNGVFKSLIWFHCFCGNKEKLDFSVIC